MAHFRVEAVLDNTTKLYSFEACCSSRGNETVGAHQTPLSHEEQAFEHFERKCSRRHSPDKEPAKELKPNDDGYRPFRC